MENARRRTAIWETLSQFVTAFNQPRPDVQPLQRKLEEAFQEDYANREDL